MPALPCGVLVFGEDLVIQDANEAAARLLGYERAEIVREPVMKLLSRAGQIFFSTHVFPVLAMHGRADELYLRLRAKSGEEIPVLLNGERDAEDGLYTCVFLAMRRRQLFEQELIAARSQAEAAATAEREAKEQIRVVQAQLAVRERLASLGTLAAGVAPEINNPLACVTANLEVLEADLASPVALDRQQAKTLVAEAMDGAQRIRTIVRQMGHLTRPDDDRRVPLDLSAALAMAVKMTRAQLHGRANVELLASDVPLVDADAGRLGQIFINLLVNAGQAFPSPSEDNRIAVAASRAPDGSVVVEVKDNGPGIPEELQARIFEPFFTTKAVGEGSGLGLSISRSLVESLGGRLTVESSPGKGATFRVTLPASTTPAPKQPEPPHATEAGAPTRRARILVVDDDAAVAKSFARALTAYDVTVAHSTDEAIARIRDSAPFDLVITDIMMPRRTGIDLYRDVVTWNPDLAARIVFVTGALDDKAGATLVEIGGRYLTKPVSVADLRALCEELLR